MFKKLKDYLTKLSKDLSPVVKGAKRQLRESIPAILAILFMGVFIVKIIPDVKSQLVRNIALNALQLGPIVCFMFLSMRFFTGQQIEFTKSFIKQYLYLFFLVCVMLLFGDGVVESFKTNPAETSTFVIMIVVVFIAAKQNIPDQEYGYATHAAALSYNRSYTQKDLEITSVHEAGHALASVFLPSDTIKFLKVDISPGFSGSSFFIDGEHIHKSKKDIYARMLIYLAGNVAEEILLEDMFNGSFVDNEQWERAAKTYLSCGFGDFYYSAPDSPLETEENQKALGRLREEHLSALRKFFSENKEVLIDLSDQIKNKKILTAEEIRPFLTKVVTL